MSLHTLYLCYFGLREPLVQTQVLPYLRQIRAGGVKISLLTFEANLGEKWSAAEIAQAKENLAGENINWFCLPYHKSPSVPATFYDVVAGARFARRLIRDNGVNVLHARSHVPAMMGAIAKAGRPHVKMIFDIRGFMPEEYTDAGVWRQNGKLYQTVKNIERRLLNNADAFVVLTEKARAILFPESAAGGFDKFERPVEVIPCCVDLARFAAANQATRDEMRTKLNLHERRVIVYTGSFGGWYLTGEMMDLLAVAREQDMRTFALILTQSQPDAIKTELRQKGFGETDFFVGKVAPSEIPLYLSAADIALSFIKACYSKLSSSPTKIAEYLASGLPIIVNPGVGDVDEAITTDVTGAIIRDFTRESYLRALREIENLRQTQDLADRCRRSARERFDLETVGGAKYRCLYSRLF